MPRLDAYREAHKRGLLQGTQLAGYEELKRRGLDVPTLPPTGTPLDASPRPTPPHFMSSNKDFAKRILPKWYTREKGDEGLYAEPALDLGLMVEDAAAGPLKIIGKAGRAIKAASKTLGRYSDETLHVVGTKNELWADELAFNMGAVKTDLVVGHRTPHTAYFKTRKEAEAYKHSVGGDADFIESETRSLIGTPGELVRYKAPKVGSYGKPGVSEKQSKFHQPTKGAKPVKAPSIEYDETILPENISYLHEVTSTKKRDALVKLMEKDGWVGPPILVADSPARGTLALTGSHRVAAARKAGVEVPVKHIESKDIEKWIDETTEFFQADVDDFISGRNEDRLERLLEIGNKDDIALMRYEIDKEPFHQLTKGAKPVKDIKPLGDKFLTSKGDLDTVPGIQKSIFEKMPSPTTKGKTVLGPSKHMGASTQKFLKKLQNRSKTQGKVGALRINKKTGMSLDFCTDCAKRAGPKGPCQYCYVDHGRTWGKILEKEGKRMPTNPAIPGEFQYNHDIMYMPKPLIDNTNRNGGLRMFSLGDYRPSLDHKNVSQALADSKARSLYIKAITKEEDFIKQFGNHPNLRANISVDLVPREMSNSPTVEEALDWAAGRKNINVRGVALNWDQAHIIGQDKRYSVITLYHGISDPNKLMKIIKEQNPQLIKKFGEPAMRKQVESWHNFSQREVMELAKKYPGRVCCQGGNCAKDLTKCGFGLVGAGFILPGVMFPEEKQSDQ